MGRTGPRARWSPRGRNASSGQCKKEYASLKTHTVLGAGPDPFHDMSRPNRFQRGLIDIAHVWGRYLKKLAAFCERVASGELSPPAPWEISSGTDFEKPLTQTWLNRATVAKSRAAIQKIKWTQVPALRNRQARQRRLPFLAKNKKQLPHCRIRLRDSLFLQSRSLTKCEPTGYAA